MDKLARYKLDKAFTDGVVIRLDDAPDVEFLVRLPSQYNRGYTQSLYGGMKFDIDGEGNVKPGGGLMEARFAQEDAFLSSCLLSIDGEAVPDSFGTDYPIALQELMTKATDLANAIEERVGDSVKKSSASSTGKSAGQGEKVSTAGLKKAAG